MTQTFKTSEAATTFTLPLLIHISLGAVMTPSQVSAQSIDAAKEVSLLEKVEPDTNYSNRPGYDKDFIGFHVPMPTLSSDIKPLAVKLPGGGTELKYYHYSVIMNGRRRLAFVWAGNFDANANFFHEREEGDK